MRETDLATASDADLAARYAEDGHVLLRSFLPRDTVLRNCDAYQDLFAAAKARGVLPTHGVKAHPAYEFVRTSACRQFVEQPFFRKLAERMTDAPFAAIRRTPLRHFPAGTRIASRAHIDGTATDVVAHSPDIIHATLDAVKGKRLSTDIRFRRVDGPRNLRWDKDWSSDDGY